jgi:hypothetical protein
MNGDSFHSCRSLTCLLASTVLFGFSCSDNRDSGPLGEGTAAGSDGSTIGAATGTSTSGMMSSGSDSQESLTATEGMTAGESTGVGGSDSTSGEPFPADMCGDLLDEVACMNHQNPCRWIDVIEVAREGDACEVVESGRCVGYSEGGGGGCETTTSCPLGSTPFIPPFYRIERGAAFVIGSLCTTSPPLGWTWCNTGEAATADPPECACACELYPGFEGASTGA